MGVGFAYVYSWGECVCVLSPSEVLVWVGFAYVYSWGECACVL
jgi:hypothetical protein